MMSSYLILTPVEFYVKQQGAKITSSFGMRKHPITGKMTMHNGTDIGGKPRGYVWRTPYAGIITHLGEHGTRGKVVVQRIEDLPLLQITQHHDDYRCRVGDKVQPGDPIGTNGTSGNVTGPHLHYELRWDNGTTLGGPVWGDPENFDIEKARKELSMKEYTVKKGDTLAKIASTHGIHPWQQLVDWNRDRYPDIGTGKNALVREGWVLRLYDPATEAEGISRAEFDALAARVKSLENIWAKIKAL